ncbi:MAG: hypothetical protein K2X45_15640 [Phreatobacter sp.]|nr:hypothetical protein [Phreatobacter sp.]
MVLHRRQVLLAATGLVASVPTLAWAEVTRRYHSDYFSFVGSDAQGTVYLAHDNNRGQTGERFFADHWIAMFAEGQGVVPVAGSAHYPNPDRILETIPDSEHFQFRGTVAGGMRMVSVTNDIDMAVEGLAPILRRQTPDNDYWIGAASATMRWKGRELRGRVIFEFIARTGFNRFTSDFGANWNNFNGLYLWTEDNRDIYLRYHDRAQPGVPRESGMTTVDGAGVLSDIDFRIRDSRPVLDRPYRWPTLWQVGFTHRGAAWQLEAETVALDEVADWRTGGFAMAVIRGTLARSDGSARRSFKGWAELLI